MPQKPIRKVCPWRAERRSRWTIGEYSCTVLPLLGPEQKMVSSGGLLALEVIAASEFRELKYLKLDNLKVAQWCVSDDAFQAARSFQYSNSSSKKLPVYIFNKTISNT
ncbi:hypothetical protein H5410_026174 [Solanum commersonii]|uniref:Uncharacterized protein n=1 Tax=Solanum commersonii TaxID=4109 RepID=A0A9J5YWA5_SOLCO|nr:hypothetical protein H5410_026174 [Solanum commersonii]